MQSSLFSLADSGKKTSTDKSMKMTEGSYYMAYGLLIHSEVALPQFRTVSPGEPDVVVRLSIVPQALSNPRLTHHNWQAAPDYFLLFVEDKMRCRVIGGREIQIECLTDSEDSLDAFRLVSSVWTALLQQRGFLTLHASGVWTKQGAVLFLADSGVGKSMLASVLITRGFNALTDDVGAVRLSSGVPVVMPGYPSLRLKADALDFIGMSSKTRHLVQNGGDKHLLPAERFALEPQVVRAIYVLGKGRGKIPRFKKLMPSEAFRILLRFTHRRRYMEGLERSEPQFNTLKEVARKVPVTLVSKYREGITLSNLVDEIECRIA